MRRLFCLPLSLLCLAINTQASTQPAKANWVTSPFPPLQYMDTDGKPLGYVSKLICKLQNISISHGEITFSPWQRAMQTTETTPNTFLFSASRTPERENKFLWIGEVSPYTQIFYSIKPIAGFERLNNFDDLRRSNAIVGVQRGSNLQTLLKEKNIDPSQIELVNDYRTSIKMLYAGRIDLVPLTYFLAEGAVCSLNLDQNKLMAHYAIEELASPLWLAANLNTDSALVEKYRDTLSKLTASGWLEEITKTETEEWTHSMCASR